MAGSRGSPAALCIGSAGVGFVLVSQASIVYGDFAMLWERRLNATDRLEGLRSNILCVARRPG